METATLIGMLICASSPLIIYWRMYRYKKAVAKASYPVTEGKIVKSELRIDRNESTDSNNRTEVTYDYIPCVEFSYTVNGNTYTGDQIHVLESKVSQYESEARKVLASYPLHATVSVYHNPQNPEDAFLENNPGTRMIDGGTWFASIMAMLIGLAIIFLN